MRELCARSLALVCVAGLAAACDGDPRPAPQDLTVRDLLGLDPSIAARWSADDRADARHTLDAALGAVEPDGELVADLDLDDATPAAPAATVARGLDRADADLAADDERPRLAVRARVDGAHAQVTEVALGGLPDAATVPSPVVPVVLVGWDAGEAGGWADLPRRAPGLLVAIAEAAGRAPTAGPLEVAPAPRVAFAAAWIEGRDLLLVNPVLLAAVDDAPGADAYPVSVGATALAVATPDRAPVAADRPPAEAPFDVAANDAGAVDAGTSPPPSSGGDSCAPDLTCDNGSCSSCDGSSCSGSSCSGSSCSGSGGNTTCSVAPRGQGGVALWAAAPLLLLRRWRRRERRRPPAP